MQITLKAPAKINLFLEITGKRPDGYHNLESIMQTVSLYDELTFEPADVISLSVIDGRDGSNAIRTLQSSADTKYRNRNPSVSDLPLDDGNIIIRAAKALKERFCVEHGAKITLQKNIPMGAGLGGGSSDAAAALKALNKLWQTNASKAELEQIAVKLGADVPFFLTGGCCLCEGIGEIVKRLKAEAGEIINCESYINNDTAVGQASHCEAAAMPKQYDKSAADNYQISNIKLQLVLVNPKFGVPTPSVYKKVRFPFTNTRKIDKIKNLILNDLFDKKSAHEEIFNRLENYVFGDYPEIAKIKSVLKDLNCASLMSGSGATVFGIYEPQDREKIEQALKKHNWSFWFVESI
jgi:4-diphosphocytidyl-2-C-methyl-D-erythritol kinase